MQLQSCCTCKCTIHCVVHVPPYIQFLQSPIKAGYSTRTMLVVHPLTSRNSLRAFWQRLSWSSMASSPPLNPCLPTSDRTRGSFTMLLMIFLRVSMTLINILSPSPSLSTHLYSLSMRLNRACSLGRAPRPKMGSRYTHLRWIWFRLCRKESRSASLFSQRVALSAKPLKYGESLRLCSRHWLSPTCEEHK